MTSIRMPLTLVLCSVAACSGGGDDGGSAPDAEPIVSNVTEVDCASATIAGTITTSGFTFSPDSLTISVGEVVEFDPMSSHDVNGTDPGLTVGLDGDACFSFDAAGTYDFHCTPHGFTGEIIVQ